MGLDAIAPVDVSARVQNILSRFERAPLTAKTSASQMFQSVLGRAMDGSTPASRLGTASTVDPRAYAAVAGTGWNASGAAAVGTGDVPAAAAQHRQLLETIARREGVPVNLLAAVAWSESNFRPEAESPAGAIGMMQLMPGTAAGLGVDPHDLVENVTGGARYLRQMLDRFGRLDLALAAYNAGPGAVDRHGGIPPFEETQNYVQKVLARRERLEAVAW
jgi:soluble lytic murein transglycosylase-like protein